MEFNSPKKYFDIQFAWSPQTVKMVAQPPQNYRIQNSQKYLLQFSKNAEFFYFKEKNEGTKRKLQEI